MNDHRLDPIDDLVKEAMSVIVASADLPHDERSAILDEWAMDDEQHEIAMSIAQEQWALFGSLPDDSLSLKERMQLRFEVAITHLSDHPGRASLIASALVLAMGVPIVLSISDLSTDQHPPSSTGELPYTDEFTLSTTRYVTARGEQREIDLPDGSRLWLNWNSDVLVADLGGEVHVDVLLGDAMFSPSGNEDVALVVHAGEAYAYDPSTDFAVHTHGTQDAAFAAKSDGLSLTSKTRLTPLRLTALQQVSIVNGESGAVQPVSEQSIGDWREEQIVFDERPLLDAIYSLSHYTAQPLQVGVIEQPNRRVTATFSMREADDALMELANTYNLTIEQREPGALRVWSVGDKQP